MMLADPTALVHRYFEYVINNEDVEVADEILTEDVVCSIPSGETLNGRSTVKAAVGNAAAAFPHRGVTIIEEIYSGDLAAIRYSIRMAHTGEFQGIAPTGREVSVDAVDLRLSGRPHQRDPCVLQPGCDRGTARRNPEVRSENLLTAQADLDHQSSWNSIRVV